MLKEKPLFIPLKTEYYNDFMSGKKSDELRQYGPRWNEKTCRVGRPVLLSKGYGTKNRATSNITKFEKKMGSELTRINQEAILDCFGTLDIEIAVIGIFIPVLVLNSSETSNFAEYVCGF